ncbi:uncharacterized protein EV154DRAFT_486065 [Mucor mucedo]|uniref:uncharacterized protein n=1 Tax=Mucor mucedo TaxID=29922 RepID=UPI002220B366|nr:uncharacterized protein EV154DRAFT_486065 [Mucor mucedo]KAI7879340.1 hypothetical protein EV154DRAFT_486065 [Mucor mucedo]
MAVNPGQTTTPTIPGDCNKFIVNRRGSSQPVLFSMDNSLHGQLTSQNNSLWLQNFVHIATSNNNSVQSKRRPITGSRSFTLINKGAIKNIRPTTTDVYSSMFVIPKKNRGSPPVFNLN